MKILNGVSYHEFGDKVYVHSVATQHDYIIDGIATDVLNYCKENPDCSFEELCARLAELYEIPDDSGFQRDILEFVENLQAEKILGDSDSDKELWTDEISEEVGNFFAREHKLFSMCLELTYRCVEKCIHCYIDDAPKFCAKDELTLDEYKGILKQAREMGCVRILLTGGEVLLRRDFCELVEYAVSLGLIVDVYTTGIGLTDEIFDRLCAANVNSVSFSLYSGMATEHDALTGLPGSFEKTLKAMLMFNSAGVQTFIKCVAMQQNFSALESVYKLGKRLKIRVSISPQIVFGHTIKSASDFRLTEEQYKEFFQLESRYKFFTFPEEKPTEISRRLNNPPCYAGQNHISIDPLGGVHPCLAFTKPFGSLREESLQILWEKVRCLKYFRNFTLCSLMPKCAECEFIEFCRVCVGDLLKENNGVLDDCGDTLKMARAQAAANGGGKYDD